VSAGSVVLVVTVDCPSRVVGVCVTPGGVDDVIEEGVCGWSGFDGIVGSVSVGSPGSVMLGSVMPGSVRLGSVSVGKVACVWVCSGFDGSDFVSV
jgi:hypothetical protein